MIRPISDYQESISDINVTPFVDVLLVLLVIFMITAPLFTQKAIDVQLPQEKLRSSQVKDARKFIITINKNGKYYLEGKRYSAKNLVKHAIEWKVKKPNGTAFIRADKRANVGDMARLMVLLKNNGIQKLGFLVKDKP
jgi:biopolymer transport protein TolR